MKFTTIKEISKKWKISERSVRNYCKEDRIEGAILKGKKWLVPIDASFPNRKHFKLQNNNILHCLLEEYKNKIKGSLYHITQIDFAYNSNHIEGSRLTREQTRYIYETNTLDLEKNKTTNIDDIIETVNHFRCFDYLLKSISDNLNEKLIKHFHKILKGGTSQSRLEWFKVGEYKTKPNYVGEQETTLPENVSKEMNLLLKWYESIKTLTLNDIIEFHVKFEKIHPFQDGNGRVGRLILFRECLRNNIVPFIVKDEIRLFYYRGLKEWNKQKGFLVDTCLKCQDDYKTLLNYLKIKYKKD